MGERRMGETAKGVPAIMVVSIPRRYAIKARVRGCCPVYFLRAGVGEAAAACLAGAKISFLAAAHFFC